MTYPLGWSLLTQTVVRRERWPGGNTAKAIPLVHPGQEVSPDQPVLRLEHAGSISSMQTLPHLSLSAAPDKTGQGSSNNGTGGTETILAGLYGRVVDITHRGGVIIESRASLLQGTIGVGNQVAGVLTMWHATSSGQLPRSIPPGAILVIPGPLNFALLHMAMNSGIAGVIASSISTRDLEGFLHTDLIRLIDCSHIEQALIPLPHLTLCLTEGLGTVAMPTRIMNLLSQHEGSMVLLSGTTSVREGIFPELIISLPSQENQQSFQPIQPDPTPVLGAQVRICGGEREGTIGIIDYLFTYEQVFSSGIRARAARLRMEDGSALIVPITVVERIG
ncbi:hypothetical protein EPA93_28735 [Ktedonosporobacter rubrisoli]|uniref:KOW domain-containing protein n=1 Tax=Ktedonosporobacter rubrisoli TaxID=2509675 RepID=A0A4P6JWJ3_KTERU|nr:hypothetical protein [Ktedonosporobacter rubrisoli]QBD79750.1 hypothetical protein EPA93_28735 [Ktedonosporobacter rubrisoli]